MHSWVRFLLLLSLLAPWSQVCGQTPPEAPQSSEPPQRQPMHWAITLALRVDQVDRAFPTVDRVVLVPDEATYVQELAR
ncbi:MAG: hypothetical protein ACYSU7_18985, partial [Planctomycetota bacterium]